MVLDANLSPRRIGGPLRAVGHDVLALAEEPGLEGLDDPLVLELAAAEGRVLVTRNSRDFAPLAREWAEAQRTHAGMILIWTLDDPVAGVGACHVAHPPAATSAGQLREIALDEIHPNAEQPRKRFDEASLNALANSIRERGVLQPIIVQPRTGGGYQLIVFFVGCLAVLVALFMIGLYH